MRMGKSSGLSSLLRCSTGPNERLTGRTGPKRRNSDAKRLKLGTGSDARDVNALKRSLR